MTPPAAGGWQTWIGHDPDHPRLFAFPHLGSGASAYRHWQGCLGGVQVLGLKARGRETRLLEDPLNDMTELVDEVVASMHGLLDRPYALFGHSMGAYVAFETALRIEAADLPAPACVLVSGADAPELASGPLRDVPPHLDAVDWIQGLGGMPPEVLASEALLELLAPAIRADFALLRDYAATTGVLSSPLAVCWSRHDPLTSEAGRRGWSERSAAEVTFHEFGGDHFSFVQPGHAAVARLAEERLLLEAAR